MNRVLQLSLVLALAIIASVAYVSLRSPGAKPNDALSARSSAEPPNRAVIEAPILAEEPRASRPNPVVASPPATTSAEPTVQRTEQQAWSSKYAGASIGILRDRAQELHDRLDKLSKLELEKRLAAGQFELVGKAGSYQAQSGDNDLIFEVVMYPGETQFRKVTLPRSEFSDLYGIKREWLWLDKQARDLESKRSQHK